MIPDVQLLAELGLEGPFRTQRVRVRSVQRRNAMNCSLNVLITTPEEPPAKVLVEERERICCGKEAALKRREAIIKTLALPEDDNCHPASFNRYCGPNNKKKKSVSFSPSLPSTLHYYP